MSTMAAIRDLPDAVLADDVGGGVMIFRVGGERFAMGVGCVEAVVEMPSVQTLPAMPGSMLGVCELRGGQVSVYSPAAVLNVASEDADIAIIARIPSGDETGNRRVAIAVEEAIGAIAYDPSAWGGVGGAPSPHGLVRGVSMQDGQLTTLLDAPTFLAACADGRTSEEG